MFSSPELRAVLNSLGEGLVVLNPQGRVAYLNLKAAEYLNSSGLDLMGKLFSGRLVPLRNAHGKRIKAHDFPHILAKKADQLPYCGEFVLNLGNNDVKHLSFSCSYCNTLKSNLIGVTMTIKDITADKKETFQQQQFIHTIGHELKHPLTSIRAYCYFLEKRMNQGNLKSAKMYLSQIDQQVELLNHMLNDLTETTKIAARMFRVELEPVEINHFINQLMFDLRPVYPKRVLEFIPSHPVHAMLDQTRMRQVLVNLISNAAKYSPRNSKIVIRVDHHETYVFIHVQDFGMGIIRQNIGKVFTPYFRSKQSKSRTKKGLGLGLYVASQIVAQHHGKIQVQSTRNRGSTFIIQLPVMI